MILTRQITLQLARTHLASSALSILKVLGDNNSLGLTHCELKEEEGSKELAASQGTKLSLFDRSFSRFLDVARSARGRCPFDSNLLLYTLLYLVDIYRAKLDEATKG